MKSSIRVWLIIGAIAVGILVLLALLGHAFPGVLSNQHGQINLTRTLLILVFVVGSLFLRGRLPMGHVLRYGLIWIALVGVLVMGYGFRPELGIIADRFVAGLLPHRGQVLDGMVAISAGQHGHFVVEADVDGQGVRFLVDTGASDVVLSPFDARRLGLDPENLSFTKAYRTANGVVKGAPVRLGRITIGPIVVRDVRASVNGAAMKRSLLGMSFLSRLSGYEVSGGRLVLKP